MPAKRSNPDARYWQAVRAAERKIIGYYLAEANSVPEAAKLMEMDKAWLYRKMIALDIENPYPKRTVNRTADDDTDDESIDDTSGDTPDDDSGRITLRDSQPEAVE